MILGEAWREWKVNERGFFDMAGKDGQNWTNTGKKK